MGIPRPDRAPGETQRSGFAGERTSDAVSELCRLRRSEGYGVREDEGKHRVRLYAGHRSGALPRTPVFTGSYEEGVLMQRKKKTEIITLRVTPQVKERIRDKAQELGLTVTDYLCLCGLGKRIVRVDGLDKVLSELKAQGRNLNQLTTLANMGKVNIVYGDRLAERYEQVSEQLRQLLREVT